MAFHYPLARRAGTLLLTGLLLAQAPVTASTPTASGPDDCTADAGTLAGYKPADCLQDGGTAIGGIPLGDAVVPPGHAINWVLALQPEGIIVQVRDESIFDVYAEGHYSIHTIVHDPLALDLAAIIPGTTTLAQLEAMLVQGGGAACGALDMTGTGILVENPATGGHFPYKDQDCLEQGGTLIGAQPVGGAHVPAGYTMTYLFSHGTGQVIVASAAEPYYTAPDTGLYAIHALVYHPATLNMGNVVFGTTTIADLNALLLQGGGGICATLDVDGAQTQITPCPDEECLADAGGLAGYKPADCLQDGGTAIGGIPLGDAVVPPGHAINWVLALQPEGIIVQVRDESIFDVYAEGHYSIHTIVHDPLALDLAAIIPGTTTLAQLEAMLVQGGGAACGALDMTGTGILVENPATGGHFPYKDQDCLEEGGTLIGAQPVGGTHVPAGYTMTYLFSHGTDQVIVASAAEPYYTAPDTGLYAIHALVYHPATLNMGNVVFGTTTIADINALLLQGGGGICAALDVDGAQTQITPCPDEECLADAGTLDGDSGEFGCLEPGGTVTITAFPNGDAVVPPGHEVIFLLAPGPDQVVIDIHTLPEFTVSAEGTYHVHTVVYDPATFDPTTVAGIASIPMVHALMIGGGGTLCGAVDTVGAAIDVAACPDQCLAYAGTLTATATPVCMDNGAASITAVPNGDAFVPPGHATVYLLTLGQSQVVLNAGVLPTFTVNAPGTYGIHAMVFQLLDYDPGSIELGVTTLAQINAMLVPGGGSICAGLDLVGATVTVNDCGPGCVALAGSLIAAEAQVCLLFGTADISAVPVGNGNVPDGYATMYLLTADGVITGMEETPAFMVDAPGTYGLHALVHDPATLDPAVIAPGITTLAEVDAMLEQGGGAICGSLGMTGAPVLVIDCAAQCAADAGTLTAADDEVFLAGGSASFFAFANGDMLVPPGHQVLYLLSAEGTVTATAPTPVFIVSAAGTYTIHTLVYDPATFNPATIGPGTSTIAGLHAQFIPGGGALCGDLDGTGATMEVVDCTDDCTAYAGTLSPVAPEVCHVAAGTVVAATHNGDAIKPVCFERIYFLSMGAQQVLINASVTADFVVDATGLYTIHTLVFDPHTLDPNSVTFGLTTAAQLEALLVQGGGTICASLDMAGAVVQVVDCLAPGQATGFKVWPSPAHRTIHAEAAGDAPAWISIWTMQGTCVRAPTPMHTDGTTAIDISDLRPGQYIVRMTSDDQVRTERFVKAE